MQEITQHFPEEVVKRAARIKLLLTDVDGVLTDGGIIYDDNGLEYKKFNVKDGQIMKLLASGGFTVGAITGRESPVVKDRMDQMGMNFHYHGVKDKLGRFRAILEELNLKPEEAAYLGDDIIDIPVFEQCGLAVCPADAPSYIKPYVHYTSERRGGQGVFRQIADLLLASQNKFESALQAYFTQYQQASKNH